MTRRFVLVIGVAIAGLAVACGKADEPKAPAPAASTGASAITADAGGEVDAAGGPLRALPMPQQFPHVVLDAAIWDAAKR